MAFVFKAEKKDSLAGYASLPGPGQYNSQEDYTVTENKIGFLSTSKRDQIKPTDDPELGPGSYNVTGDLLAPDKTQNVFFMPAEPGKEIVQSKATNVFKSKAKRFENNINNENPGPGSYNQEFGSNRKNYPKPSSRSKMIQNMVQQERAQIPSIPSNVHSYGYTENDGNYIIVNMNINHIRPRTCTE